MLRLQLQCSALTSRQNGYAMRDSSSIYRRRRYLQRAASQFERLWLQGKIKAMIAHLSGETRTIPYLDDEVEGRFRAKVEHLGVRPIRLNQIVGTRARMIYDRDFLPLQREDKKRWMSVAMAMMEDVTKLRPISVVQIEDRYYTLDGNHRVSVARTLGKLYMDADVTLWSMSDADDAPGRSRFQEAQSRPTGVMRQR